MDEVRRVDATQWVLRVNEDECTHLCTLFLQGYDSILNILRPEYVSIPDIAVLLKEGA